MDIGPGISLFTDAGSIHLDRKEEEELRAEEEEELRDQERRKAQLANELEGAFDDLNCDDDTLNSLTYQSNYTEDDEEDDDEPRPPAGGIQGQGNHYQQARLPPPVSSPRTAAAAPPPRAPAVSQDSIGGSGVRELRLLLEAKTRELQNLAQAKYEKEHAHDQQLSELHKQLLLEQAEKDRAIMTRDQSRELLVKSKTQISDLEDANEKLRSKVRELEDRNVALVAELEQKNTMLQDSLHRYQMLEQNSTQKADRHTDAMVREMEERHGAKVAMMQQQIDNLRSQLEDKRQECRRFEARYAELQKSREALLIEKTETVQRLQDQLEDSQRQCGNLLSKSKGQGDFEQERSRMRSRIGVLEAEHTGMRQTIADLTNQLEKTQAELELMDSLVHSGGTPAKEHPDVGTATLNGDTNAEDGGKLPHNHLQGGDMTSYAFTHRNLIGSTPNNHQQTGGPKSAPEVRLARLKNELLVCMTGQKEKRETIQQLEANLKARDRELEQLKKDESEALVQMNQYKEEAFRLGSKCRILEQELEKLVAKQGNGKGTAGTPSGSNNRRSSYDLRQEALEDRIFTLQQTKLEAEEQIEQLQKENERLTERVHKLSTESNSCAELRLEVEKQKFLLADAQDECDRLKRLYVEVSGARDEINQELATLRSQDSAKEIAALQEQIVSLERTLKLTELKSNELAKLLDKEKTSHEALLKQLTTAGGGGDGQRYHTPTRESKNVANTCTKCIDGLAQITKLEIENIKLQSTCTAQLREIAELRAQLDDQQATITELHERLDLKAIRDQELDDLKEKAAQFHEFMRSQQHQQHQRSASSPPNPQLVDSGTSPVRIASRDQSVGPDELLEHEDETESEQELEAKRRQQMREQEQQVREEMARAFAAQIKQIEQKFRTQFASFESNIASLKQQLHERESELQVRNQEVEVLKCAIVTEREKVGEMLRRKDADARSLFDKQQELLGKYKAELANGQRKVQFLEHELQEKRDLIQSERQSMEKLMAQIATERTTHREREQEMIDKCTELEAEYRKSLDLVTDKYQSAKKTALNYKKYAEDKEQHMLKEYDRIKEGYNAALVKVQNRMKEALDSKERALREKMAKLEAEYAAKHAVRTEQKF
ncbi:trichohyalin [Anopheles aquasalis]|uniref:trichohyalin n=1 Tax=Anopheles aquasalis TaxID=42839 RepID=UPI00215AE159|nr:trichohyalin [Anopheles aquasalis]